ncbi:hypothetical protein PtA15_11A609 [Puccinia triticina]|uniref:Uncharacterized protein n=1 Tax=Puccinia triticina TaxID=208348 RepID=A0ABY7CZQ8_9BASI|nr:uncharacterized protein PtA15_11A609 [Puccinia triticina]WAQ89917.1 hypothetical protein PtA15_11A609 [Puccinia triticina]
MEETIDEDLRKLADACRAETIAMLLAVDPLEYEHEFDGDEEHTVIEPYVPIEDFVGLREGSTDPMACPSESLVDEDDFEYAPAADPLPYFRSDASGSGSQGNDVSTWFTLDDKALMGALCLRFFNAPPPPTEDDFEPTDSTEEASEDPQGSGSPSDAGAQDGERRRKTARYVAERAMDHYWRYHPTTGPQHPDALPVRHPRALTLIMREPPPVPRGLGTPATPREGARGVLRTRRRREDDDDDAEQSRPTCKRRLG